MRERVGTRERQLALDPADQHAPELNRVPPPGSAARSGGPSILLAVLCAIPLIVACGSGGKSADGGRGTEGGAGDLGGITPSAVCDQYLECLSAAEPQAFPVALSVYKPDGPCWGSKAAREKCEQACLNGFDALAKTYPTKPACGGAGTYDGGRQGWATGETCTVDYECEGGVCLKSNSFPSGYCSRECGTNTSCPVNEKCIVFGTKSFCLKACESTTDCSNDQKCLPSGVCLWN